MAAIGRIYALLLYPAKVRCGIIFDKFIKQKTKALLQKKFCRSAFFHEKGE